MVCSFFAYTPPFRVSPGSLPITALIFDSSHLFVTKNGGVSWCQVLAIMEREKEEEGDE